MPISLILTPSEQHGPGPGSLIDGPFAAGNFFGQFALRNGMQLCALVACFWEISQSLLNGLKL